MPSMRFAYTTDAFPATVAFWQLVGLHCVRNETLGPDPHDDRVAWFDAGDGAVIEVIESAAVVPGNGSWIAVQVENVDELFGRLVTGGVAVLRGPTTMSDERNCSVREPNGVGVIFFTPR